MKRKKKKAVTTRPLGAWCQVRISPALARALTRLPSGEKARVVRDALFAVCKARRISTADAPDRRQAQLPGVK
jgi:hypothetical protein